MKRPGGVTDGSHCGCQGGPFGVQIPEEGAPPAEAGQQRRPGAESEQPQEPVCDVEEGGTGLASSAPGHGCSEGWRLRALVAFARRPCAVTSDRTCCPAATT